LQGDEFGLAKAELPLIDIKTFVSREEYE